MLQVAVAILGAFPVLAGFQGIIGGLGLPGDADSDWRFLSGVQLGLGAAFWATIPRIEERGDLFRVLTLITVVGGLARLGAALAVQSSSGVWMAVVFELVAAPLVALWRERMENINIPRPGPWG